MSVREHRLSDGGVLYVLRHAGTRETAHTVSLPARCLQIGCCLQGSVAESPPPRGTPSPPRLVYSPRRSGLLFTSEDRRVWTFAPGECRMVVACLPPRKVFDCWEAGKDDPPDVLQALAGSGPPEPFFVELPATAAMRMAARSLMDMPVQAAWRNRYLQCKVTELLLLAASALPGRQKAAKDAASPLTRKDIACLHAARDILVARMEQPPTLKTLARSVGINECKLKRGFVQLFGMTPYTCLRQARLDQAWRYLENGGMGVCEACMAVGYVSPSNFINLFRRRYGITPGEMRRLAVRVPHAPAVETRFNGD
ncbi:MAG: helix-turn-helix domain-containing protein [Thermodesulfobacteriota bacterium]